MRAEARGVAHMAHVAEEQRLVRVAQVQLGLDAAVVNIPLGEPLPMSTMRSPLAGGATA
jgi:hypothetical protein